MEYILSANQMKTMDNYTIEHIGIPSAVLMEKAALSVVEEIKQKNLNMQKILIVCGIGNNGGDGLAIARLLFLEGCNVDVVILGDLEKMSAEAKRQYSILKHYPVHIHNNFYYEEYTIIIDALFGIGLTRELSGDYLEAINKLNEMPGYKVAVDIPSGINADNGRIMKNAIKCDLTVAIANKKIGHLLYPGKEYCGEVVVRDIGILPREEDKLNNEFAFSYTLKDLDKMPVRNNYSNKGSYGRVVIFAGSKNMAGAALLAGKAAYRTGCGLVEIVTEISNREIIQTALPEAILTTYDRTKEFDKTLFENVIKRAAVIDIGPGLAVDKYSTALVELVLEVSKVPIIIDADALNILSDNLAILKNRQQKNVIITPHLKEMSRLNKKEVSYIQNNLIECARDFAVENNLVCILKDASTIVADYSKKVYINQSGNNGMATAGSGDVLSGIVAALISQKSDEFQGAALAVFLHGVAGDMASARKNKYAIMAGDICEELSYINVI